MTLRTENQNRPAPSARVPHDARYLRRMEFDRDRAWPIVLLLQILAGIHRQAFSKHWLHHSL
jgi:hypothetical protein